MKRLSILVGLVCLNAMLLPACAPAPEPEPEAAPEPVFDPSAEEAALRKVTEQLQAARNKHDIEAYAALCAENFETWDGGTKGRADWVTFVSDLWEREKDRQYKLLDEIGIVFVTPNVAIQKYRDEVAGSLDADGKPLPPQKRLLARVWVKESGQWLFVKYFTRPIEE